MKRLSDATVREIILLSKERLAAIPKNQTQGQVLKSILGVPSPEEQALQDSLNKLNHGQALRLVALMYVGQYLVENEPYEDDRDDEEGLGEQLPMEKLEDVYKDHIRNFQYHDVETLISMCDQKTSVLHRYLEAALGHC